MSILIDRRTTVICQGFTGRLATFHCQEMLEYGTRLVGGVTPGRGGQTHLGLPVFNTMQQAVAATGATVSIVFVPAVAAADAMLEAAEAGIELIVCVTQGVPVHDMMKVKAALRFHGARLLGPNCPGVITAGESKVGVMPGDIYQPGAIGIVSRSDMLTYEAAVQTTRVGLGQTTCVGIGGDPVLGMSLVDCLKMFDEDRKTKGIVLVGEIGGTAEEEAAEYIKAQIRKPVVAYIAGVTSPPDKRMGHASVIMHRGRGTAREKFHALETAGAAVVRSPADIGTRMLEFFEG